MKSSTLTCVFVLLLAACLATACGQGGGGPAEQPAQPSPVQVQPTQPVAAPAVTILPGAFMPLPLAECQQIQEIAAGALKVGFALSEAPFTGPGSEGGVACNLVASGTGVDFAGMPEVMRALLGAFGDWSEDNDLAAGGPTGEMAGLRRGDDLMIIAVHWQPSEDANCPDDQPIALCELKPEQRLYTITIEVVRK